MTPQQKLTLLHTIEDVIGLAAIAIMLLAGLLIGHGLV